MAVEFYVFSEEYDTKSEAFAKFEDAVDSIDEDDRFSCIFTVEDGVITDCHDHVVGADEGEEFQRNSDSPYLGMNIEEVG